MSAAEFKMLLGDFWPYFAVAVVGFLPTEVWRVLGVLVAKDLSTDSEFLVWVRLVASVLLAAVVAKLVVVPTGMLATIPLWGRVSSISMGAVMLLVFRRSVAVAVGVGEVVLIASWFLNR